MVGGQIQTEIIYSFVIIIASLMIYFATKEIYNLSSHKGIKYLRESFLFFAIAFFFRSFIKLFFILSSPSGVFELYRAEFQMFSLLIFIYFSLIAIFYLLYSLTWKKFNKRKVPLFLHLGVSLISIFLIGFNNVSLYILINILILILIIFVSVYSYKNSKRQKNNLKLYTIYFLLFVFWALNAIDVLIPNFLQTYQLLIYLSSTTIFLSILYKVLKKSGVN